MLTVEPWPIYAESPILIAFILFEWYFIHYEGLLVEMLNMSFLLTKTQTLSDLTVAFS